MTDTPDPRTVHALAQQVANRALHDNVHLDQWIADALVAAFGEGDLETRVAYHPAVARRLALVKAAWPDEQQPEDGPESNTGDLARRFETPDKGKPPRSPQNAVTGMQPEGGDRG